MLEFTKQPTTAAEVSFLVSYYRPTPIAAAFDNFKNNLSMLHADVLSLMYHFGSHSTGNILELGPFIGGSTIALAMGLRDSDRAGSLCTVEAGGAFDHPTMGATDIVGSLRANLKAHEVDEKVTVVVGNSRDTRVGESVRQVLSPKSVGLFVIDSDGLVLEDFEVYSSLLTDGAYLIVDDYFCPGNQEKGNFTKHGIDTLESKGLVQTLGVYGWGTWFGKLAV